MLHNESTGAAVATSEEDVKVCLTDGSAGKSQCR